MSPSSAPNWWNQFTQGNGNYHERLKHSVHSFWRQSTILSPRGTVGKVVMGCFYFSIPVVVGYVCVTKVVDMAEQTVQERVGGSSGSSSGSGIEKEIMSTSSSSIEKVGAGGWGGGVNLATSDKGTQNVNRINLERFMKKQRRLKEKRERREAAAAAAAATQE